MDAKSGGAARDASRPSMFKNRRREKRQPGKTPKSGALFQEARRVRRLSWPARLARLRGRLNSQTSGLRAFASRHRPPDSLRLSKQALQPCGLHLDEQRFAPADADLAGRGAFDFFDVAGFGHHDFSFGGFGGF